MTRKFKRVLVANRGEIALRVIRALRDLQIESVAVYSEADAQSMHRHLADYAVPLKGRTSSDSYLDIEQLSSAIKRAKVDAVHPGYGFLSENARFAEACQKLGVKFIGPSADAMEKMGDKITARKIMADAGVPLVPGSDHPLKDWQELKSLADEIGYPLIIKAAAGGGGRGMRVVHEESELQSSYDACVREAESYFANPEVFCERYLAKSRHIEVQVLFDSHGKGVYLFERDCSIQRRHQKLLEEAPSQFLNEEQRARLGEIAIKAGEAVNYEGAGTVEFICESADKCYFMEMNTRIQVEHPVTEMITGMDLISEQLRVAAGEKLGYDQKDISLNGWAFEARINAEDPARDFMPSPGTVRKLRLPAGAFVRVDTHLYEGYTIPSEYDSMVAKVISWGKTRDQAIEKLKRALAEMRVEGVPTTANFHEFVLDDGDFRSGDFYTNFLSVKQEQIKEFMQSPAKNEDSEIAAFAAAVFQNSHNSATVVAKKDRESWRLASLKAGIR